jgi:hypothetical protein
MNTPRTKIKLHLLPVLLVLAGLAADAMAAGPAGLRRYFGPKIESFVRTVTKGSVVNLGYIDDHSLQRLEVFTQKVNGVPSATITFQEIFYDPSSFVCITDPVTGPFCRFMRATYDLMNSDLPASVVTIGQDTARLYVDLSNHPGLTYSRCVVDDNPGVGTVTCTTEPLNGLIDVTWSKTSENYSKFIGAQETKTGPIIKKSVMAEKVFSARPRGTILGWQVSPTSDGNFGINASGTLTITVEQ